MAPFFTQKVWQGKGRENRIVAGGHSRTQQRFFQGGGGQGDLGRSGIHLISRRSSVSRCATVNDEYNNVSICQPTCVVLLLSQRLPCLLTYVIHFVCIVVDSILPNEVYIGFRPTFSFGNIYCIATENLVSEVSQTWM